MKSEEDFIELGEWQLSVFKQKDKYKQALEEIKEIIEFRFKTEYTTLGFKEYDEIIEDIEKIANEVLK